MKISPQEQKQFQIGVAIFEPQTQKLIFETQVTDALKGIFVKIDENHYKKYNWTQVFRLMTKYNADQLSIRNNQQQKILKQISHVQLRQLRTLYLHGNKIDNIQVLCSLNCPRIADLALDNNQIKSIRCLHKWANSDLNWLSLNDNPLKQTHSLSKMILRSQTMSYIRFEQHDRINPITEDLSLIAKLLSNLRQISTNKELRIKQQKIRKMLQNKNPGIWYS